MPALRETCSVEGCATQRRSSTTTLCVKHYFRWYRTGTVDLIDRPSQRSVCTVDGCECYVAAHGLCHKHRSRMRTRGTTDDPEPIVYSRTYNAVHLRLASARGPARAHTCQCGEPAKDWAYDHGDPEELVGPDPHGNPLPYSLDPTHYIAMCKSCHLRLDLNWGKSTLTP